MPSYVTLIIAVIGAVTGVIGLLLSIFNTWRLVDKDKVKLRVGCSWAMSIREPDAPFLCISVTNLSSFPITVREAGVFIDERKQRAIHPNCFAENGSRLPIRMEPRTQTSVNFDPEFLHDPKLDSGICVYVRTDCGEEFEAGHRDLPLMVKEARQQRGR